MKIKSALKWSLLVIPAWMGYSWLSGNSGLVHQLQIFSENKKLESRIDSLEQLKADLDRERARLRSDTAYLEKVVRYELGMAKPNEKVYRMFSKEDEKSGNTEKKKTSSK